MLLSAKPLSLSHILHQLWCHISIERHKQFFLLLGLTALSALAEAVSLSAVLPFIGILTQPEKIFASPLLSGVVKMLGINSSEELVIPLALAFALTAIAAGVLRLFLLRVSIRITNATGADLGIDVYRRTLYQPYSIQVTRSSSEIIGGITQKVSIATSVLVSGVNVLTSAILFLVIMFTLIIIDPIVAFFSVFSFGTFYGVIAWLTRERLMENSKCIAKEQTYVIKALQDGLGAIRDVLIDGTQEIYCGLYRNAILKLQHAIGQNNFISLAPRYAMEALGMALIAVFVIVLSYREGGIAAALPVLGVLALAAQRLLPLMQQLYGNWSVVAGSKTALADVLSLLDQPLPSIADNALLKPLIFKGEIQFDCVSFSYGNNGPIVLDQINLKIPKGARIGFIGSTGSGKSTALDLLMGLLNPTQGRILVDGLAINDNHKRAWQKTIAHVPQSIFLADGTIAENIAFGVPEDKIDIDLVRKVAQQAHIAEFIESRSEGYTAFVGERGVRLSGGQRQRIGIARALYKQANVFIFDEATSALDGDTERAIIETIESLEKDITILMIAHRLTTLKNCTQIVDLVGGRIARVCTYNELILESSNVQIHE